MIDAESGISCLRVKRVHLHHVKVRTWYMWVEDRSLSVDGLARIIVPALLWHTISHGFDVLVDT